MERLVTTLRRELAATGVETVDYALLPARSRFEVHRYQKCSDRPDDQRYLVVERPASVATILVNAVGVFVTALAVALSFLAYVPSLVGFAPVAVASDSMAPALIRGDLVVSDTDGFEELPEGVVVVFDNGERSIVHRVVGIEEDGYVTKGDANATVDGAIVAPHSVTGVAVMLVPFAGVPKLWIDEGQWLQLGLLVAGLAVAAWISPMSWVERRQGMGRT